MGGKRAQKRGQKNFFQKHTILLSGIMVPIFVGVILLLMEYGLLLPQSQSSDPTVKNIVNAQDAIRQTVVAAVPTKVPATPFSKKAFTIRDSGLTKNCISGYLWFPIDGNQNSVSSQCLVTQGISAQENGLHILQTSPTIETVEGILTKIQKNTKIKFKLVINTLTTPYENNVANLGFGIVSASQPDNDTNGQIFYQHEKSDFPILIKYKERGNYTSYVKAEENKFLNYEEGGVEEIKLDIYDRQLWIFINDQAVSGPVYLPYDDPAFWIGYKIPGDGNVDTFISDLSLEFGNE